MPVRYSKRNHTMFYNNNKNNMKNNTFITFFKQIFTYIFINGKGQELVKVTRQAVFSTSLVHGITYMFLILFLILFVSLAEYR